MCVHLVCVNKQIISFDFYEKDIIKLFTVKRITVWWSWERHFSQFTSRQTRKCSHTHGGGGGVWFVALLLLQYYRVPRIWWYRVLCCLQRNI